VEVLAGLIGDFFSMLFSLVTLGRKKRKRRKG